MDLNELINLQLLILTPEVNLHSFDRVKNPVQFE